MKGKAYMRCSISDKAVIKEQDFFAIFIKSVKFVRGIVEVGMFICTDVTPPVQIMFTTREKAEAFMVDIQMLQKSPDELCIKNIRNSDALISIMEQIYDKGGEVRLDSKDGEIFKILDIDKIGEC